MGALACGVGRAAAESMHGRVPPPGLGGAIDLIDQRGARFSWERVAGRPALLFFGFTRCASTCPPALGVARQVLHALGRDEAASVVFVTLDPLSDDAPALRNYLGAIDARIIGLTGHPARVEQAAERYGVALRGAGPALEHSSMWYLLDGDAVLRRVYGPATPAAHLVSDIRRLQGSGL